MWSLPAPLISCCWEQRLYIPIFFYVWRGLIWARRRFLEFPLQRRTETQQGRSGTKAFRLGLLHRATFSARASRWGALHHGFKGDWGALPYDGGGFDLC